MHNAEVFLLRRLSSFIVRSGLLKTCYRSVPASALFFALVCGAGGIKSGETYRLEKVVRKGSSVGGLELESHQYDHADRQLKLAIIHFIHTGPTLDL